MCLSGVEGMQGERKEKARGRGKVSGVCGDEGKGAMGGGGDK